jgi:5-methylcytosine-specific restriction endonuclease McrA
MFDDHHVLLLNQNYTPLNVLKLKRAVLLILAGKAELMENGRGEVRSVSFSLPLPSVIRLHYFIKRPYFPPKLTKVEVFNRDGYICQYCGRENQKLTLDHVIPRYRKGEHAWDNVVSACDACNRRKAGRTPAEAGMKLIRQPRAPQGNHFVVPYRVLRQHAEWDKYLGNGDRP